MFGFRTLFLMVCAIAAVRVSSAATSYFVTQSGEGSQDGLSPDDAWSVANYNASSLPTGGDTVEFSGIITSTVTPNTSGTGNGASRLTLDFSRATLNTADPRINVDGKNFLNITGGTFGTASSGALITFNNRQSHDVTIHGWTHAGSSASTARFISNYYCYNLTVSNNWVDNTAGLVRGDTVFNHDISILNNYVRTSLNTTVQTDIVFYGDAYNVSIQGNKFVHRTEGATTERHNDVLQTYKKRGSNAGHPHDWVIRYNWIELDVATGSGDNSWAMMENMSGDPAAKIYGNVFVGTGTVANNGIDFNSNAPSAVVYFYNNTVIRKSSPINTIRFQDSGKLYSRNNIGQANSAASGTFLSWAWSSGATWDRNFFFGSDDCSITYSGPHGSCASNPEFVDYNNNRFSLQPASVLIAAGDSTIGSEYNQGIAPGATWPNPDLVTRRDGCWDAGAFQSTACASRRSSGIRKGME